MAVDWRSLLTSIGVEWKDRGPNTSKGNININCPFCAGSDPSFHLALNEDTAAYYCFRGGRAHSGQYPARLLSELGVAHIDIYRLLQDYDTVSVPNVALNTRWLTSALELNHEWGTFEYLEDCNAGVNYMRNRGFPVDITAPKYDLRFTYHGTHRRRILFPIRYDGVIAGWTGRTVYNKPPLYKMEAGGQDGHIYIPSRITDIAVIVEGPIDALKTVIGSAGLVSAVALLGLDFGPARIARLQRALADVRKIYICLDKTVSISLSRTISHELEAALLRVRSNSPTIARVAPAGSHKDNGAATIGEIEGWTRNLDMR